MPPTDGYSTCMSTFTLQGSAPAPSRRINYHDELNQEQLDVVLHGDGAALVLAGAGSGKTRTLTYRVAYLLEQGVDPSSILLLTFTNKAAREMLERVESLLGAHSRGIWGGTFHSIGNRILRAMAEIVGFRSGFSILDQEDARDLIKAIIKEMKIDVKARRFPSPNVTHDIISYSRNAQQSIAQTLEEKHTSFLTFTNDIETIATRYQERKRLANAMDFDDLLSYVAGLLDDPVHGKNLSAPFRYVLVDEYQDTNAIQARIVKGFAQVHKNILVVGDDAQSIYAFRGADVQNILSFPKQWPGAKTFKLLTNYRSTPQILEVANESLEHNVDQFQKDLIAKRDHGDKPKLVPCSSASQEAQYVAEQILALRHEGVALQNIAVLFRSSAHSQALEFELVKRDIPYEYRGGQRFFERAHIKDTLSFLRIMVNHQDEVAWLRILGLQKGIGDTSAATIAVACKSLESLESILLPSRDTQIPKRAQDGWRDLTTILTSMRDRSGPSGMVRAVANSSYKDYLEREYPNWRERYEDLEQLALFAEKYDELSAFLNDIALYDEVTAQREQAASSRDDERIVLSTIHQAKGLEWECVFVMHLAEGSFPSRRAMSEDGMEEERRLFYVAVTRARKQLFLTYPMTVGYETLVFAQPSTFIDELPPRLFDRVEVRDSRYSASRALARVRGSKSDDFNDDHFSDDDVIEVNAWGERSPRTTASKTAWKSSSPTTPKSKPTSYLRSSS